MIHTCSLHVKERQTDTEKERKNDEKKERKEKRKNVTTGLLWDMISCNPVGMW